jgi:hypothetical protein
MTRDFNANYYSLKEDQSVKLPLSHVPFGLDDIFSTPETFTEICSRRYDVDVSQASLEWIQNHLVFEGLKTPEMLRDELKWLLSEMDPKSHIVLINCPLSTGCSIVEEKFAAVSKRFESLNSVILEFLSDKVHLLDVAAMHKKNPAEKYDPIHIPYAVVVEMRESVSDIIHKIQKSDNMNV